jgi:histidine triad (HIT) family protein
MGVNMTKHCIFCKIVNKEVPSKIVYEDDQVLAFQDIHPAAPAHILLVPKIHLETVVDIPAGDPLISILTERAVKVAGQLGLREGFRIVINNGDNGGQTVYHLHMHLLGGRFMAWPPG